MAKKILLGGLIGGIVLFLWGFVSHTMLPLGEMGIAALPEEEIVLGAMESAISEPAIYFFPGMSKDPSAEETQVWMEKYEAGPIGILVYRPTGLKPMSGQLIYQLLTDIAAVLLAALLLSFTALVYWKRVLFVTLLGLVGWFGIILPYMIWYLFPGSFTVGALIDGLLGWFLVGLLLGVMVKPPKNA
jgi:hypothetical protein